MKNLKTAIAYVKDYATTGAVSKSSSWVEQNVTCFVDGKKKQVIVEYGAGHGNITQIILEKMHAESQLFSVEINEDFCEELRLFEDKRLTVISESATEIRKYVPQDTSVDCVISSLPLTFIPDEIVDEIYKISYDLLKKDAYMIQWLYQPLSFRVFKKYFSEVNTKTGFGIPMEFIKFCKK